jgi:hypothetical protein
MSPSGRDPIPTAARGTDSALIPVLTRDVDPPAAPVNHSPIAAASNHERASVSKVPSDYLGVVGVASDAV